MSESDIKDISGLVSFTLYSENEKVTASSGITSIWVKKELNKIGKASLQIRAENVSVNEIPESDADTFAPGRRIRIDAGYNAIENTIFEGFVVSHNLDINTEGTFVKIECRDFAFPMTLNRKNRIFEDKTDAEIIDEIAKIYDFSSIILASSPVKHKEMLQYYCTDWDFILSRADANGLFVVVEGSELRVKEPDITAEALHTVKFGLDLLDFRGELTAVEQVGEIECVAWDASRQELIKVKAKTPTLNKQGNLETKILAKAVHSEKRVLYLENCSDENELQTWADGQALKIELSRIQGSVKFSGNSAVLPDSILKIEGLGERFSGNAYVGGVEHQIMSGYWTTKVQMGVKFANVTFERNVQAPPASGYLPSISGLHTAKVTKLGEDPLNEFRVQVEMPLLNGKKNSLWARLSQFGASKEYGCFFIPDIGDEVILGFFNSDPSYPVILGNLYSSKLKTPYPLTEENYKKAIVTKSKMKIEFDDENKVVSILTPGNNKIVLDDKNKSIQLTDENKNKIEMTKEGIVLDSANSVMIKAKSDIKLNAGASISIGGKSDVKLKALNVEIAANSGFKAKGNATAEVSASGQTTIKGAMVMIN